MLRAPPEAGRTNSTSNSPAVKGARLRRWLIAAGLASAALGSAYLWWWKPLLLGTLRVAIDRGLAPVRPHAAFRDLDLSGLSTLVLREVTIGSLDDPDSAVIAEVRLTFDLGSLVRSRLDVLGALRQVTLVRPQVTLTAPLAWPTAPDHGAPIGLPPGVRLSFADGRVLLRPEHPGGAVLAVTDMTGLFEPGTAGAGNSYSIRMTPPGSPRRSLSVRGSISPLAFVVALDARGVEAEPLQPWIRPLNLPVEPRRGSLHAALRLAFTRSVPGGRWTALNGSGPLTLRGVELGIAGLAYPLRDVTGTARLSGDRLQMAGVAVTAPAIHWIGGGTIDRLLSPRLALDLATDGFSLDVVDPADRGTGHCRLRLDGPPADLVLRADADLAQVVWQGAEADRVRGSFTVAPHGAGVTLTDVSVVTPAGTLTLTGDVRPSARSAVTWAFAPRDSHWPAVSGDAGWTRREATVSARTADGLWTARGTGQASAGRWEAALSANAATGARIGFTGTIGAAAPHRVTGNLAVAAAPMAALYLDHRSPLLSRMPAVITLAGPVAGTLAAPELKGDLKGSGLALEHQRMAIGGALKLNRHGLELAPVRFPGNTTITLWLPFDEQPVRPAAAAIVSDGLPLATLWPLLPVPAWMLDVAGNAFGHLDITGVSSHPIVTGSVEIRALTVKGRKLGAVACDLTKAGDAVRLSRLTFKGPVVAADGTGTIAATADGWKAESALTVSYLKLGTTDLEARANLTLETHGAARTATAKLTSLRLNAAAFSDVDARYTTDGAGGATANVVWEDLLTAVASVGGGAGTPVAVTVAATELPLAPCMGLFGLPAPAEAVSGSFSAKGPLAHAAASAALRWSRGSLEAKGWVDAAGLNACAVTFTAQDGALAPWLPLLRRHPDLVALPELTGGLEAHGFAFERTNEGAVSANGWISLRDLTIRGQRLGTGSLRVAAAPGQVVLEGSLSGEGQYTLYPTTWTRHGDDIALDSAFAWNRVPACKAFCALARGTLKVRLTRGQGDATLILAGLSLNDTTSTDVTIEAKAAGHRWTLSAPRESPWQAIGTVSAAGARIVTEADDRCGGAWVIFRGPEGAQLKLSGIWPLPGALERITVEAHSLRAVPILILLGSPPMDGLAEADLEYVDASVPPLTGRLSVTGGQWGEFPFDLFEVKGSGTPAHDFSFTSIKIERAGNLLARGTGTLTVFPERHVELNLSVERLRLGYLAPFGLVEDSDVTALGRLAVAGDPDDPDVTGSLVCGTGSYTPPTGFSELLLNSGRIDFNGHQAAFTATLADAGGAPVLMAGRADYKSLAPTAYAIDMSAPALIQVDRLPGIFKGHAKGKFRIDGTPARPAIHGDIVLEDGRIQTPAKRKHDPNEFGERADWDLTVRFGSQVKYAVEPIGGATLDMAALSPRSLIKVSGRGEDFHVTGQVLADSGPLTLFLGKELWRK